jgi:hypothetical protein
MIDSTCGIHKGKETPGPPPAGIVLLTAQNLCPDLAPVKIKVHRPIAAAGRAPRGQLPGAGAATPGTRRYRLACAGGPFRLALPGDS